MAATFLRLMHPADLAGVNALLSHAFTAARRDEGLVRAELPLCRMEFLRYYQQETPQSCWVVLDGEIICGAVFGHALGTTGWIGPLAVLPEHQNRGLGQALLRHAGDALRACGCRLVGLETDANSLHNLAFYSRLGFTPGPLQVDLVQAVDPRDAAGSDSILQSYIQHPGRFEAELPSLLTAGGIEADYLSLVRRMSQQHFGDGYMELRNGRSHLFAAMQHVPVSVREMEGVGRIMALVGPGTTDAAGLTLFLQAIGGMAGCGHVVVRVPVSYAALLTGLLRCGWRLINAHVRFYLDGRETGDAGVLHLNKWD
jgi:predicted N-acetyltransferase YhbS